MIKKEITVQHDKGLEARPIALLVQEASQYESQIHIEIGSKKINAKSIMGMMTLAVRGGDVITVITEGADEEVATKGIEDFLSGIKLER